MATATKLYGEAYDASEALVMAHLGMVKRVALHLKVRIPPFMELDELMQVGMIGLLEAARAFDPTKGIEFESFALSRVRGAILDEVRQLSYLPRSAVAFNKSENEAIHFLASELGRTPTQSELAEHLGDASILHLQVAGVADLLHAKVGAGQAGLDNGAVVGLQAEADRALAFDAAGRLLA